MVWSLTSTAAGQSAAVSSLYLLSVKGRIGAIPVTDAPVLWRAQEPSCSEPSLALEWVDVDIYYY